MAKMGKAKRSSKNSTISSQMPTKDATKVNTVKGIIDSSSQKNKDVHFVEVRNIKRQIVKGQRKKIHHHHSEDYQRGKVKKEKEKEDSWRC